MISDCKGLLKKKKTSRTMRDQVQIYKDQSYLNSTVCNSKILATQPYLLCVQLSQHSSF